MKLMWVYFSCLVVSVLINDKTNLLIKGRKREDLKMPSAGEQSRNEMRRWGVPGEPSQHPEHMNEDSDNEHTNEDSDDEHMNEGTDDDKESKH